MKFNKININRPSLSADEITSAMDFDSLINNPPAASPPVSSPASGAGKLIKLIGYGIGVAAMAVAGWFFMNKLDTNQVEKTEHNAPVLQQEESKEEKSARPLINPPLKDVLLPFETAVVSGEGESKVALGSSIIKIPQNCFIDKNGTPITGEVELKYREFNTNLDIFLSGIPMEYDSAGVNYTFESNGMFEIRGYQNGEPIAVAPEKQMEVAMEIAEAKPGFSEYFLNEETGVWDFRNGQNYEVETSENDVQDTSNSDKVGNQRVEVLVKHGHFGEAAEEDFSWSSEDEVASSALSNLLETEIEQIDKNKKNLQKPVKPKKGTDGIPQLALEVDFKDFPELKGFENTLFQVAEKDMETFDPKWGEETWNDVSVAKSSLPGNYKIVFSRPGKRVRVTCSPVVSEADLPRAMAIYENLFNKYENSVDSLNQVKKQKEKERKEALNKAREEAKKQKELAAERASEIKAQNEEIIRNRSKIVKTTAQVSAVFTANSFGYYNCDSPLGRIKGGREILATYETDSEAVIFNVTMIEQGRRAVFTRYQNQMCLLNSGKSNQFFAVTSLGKLAVAKVPRGRIDGQKNCLIKMTECQEELKNKKDIEQFLKRKGIEF